MNRKSNMTDDEMREWLLEQTLPADNGCRVWQLARHNGYGRVQYKGRHIIASRLSYSLFIGPIPDGMDILHYCDNPPCIEPTHLYLGTDIENVRDRVSRGRGVVLKGANNGNARLVEHHVREIRRLHLAGLTLAALARIYAISEMSVRRVVRRQAWAHVE